ncbi:MAG TPA: TonB-dependent receptor [Pyrinomonadaceae bacterium]|nr:TonB-dependent receptor [Pyrinomonadaceae bacterium]
MADADGGTLRGTVTTMGANSEPLNVPGAIVRLTNVAAGSDALSATTNDDGEYKFSNLNPGLYQLEITANGFAIQTRRVAIRPDQITVEDFRLEIASVKSNVTVNADSEAIQSREAAPASTLAQKTLQSVPLVNERFQDALPLIPGVVRGPDGLLNVKGARASQSGLTVNSANVTDPVTGEFAINLPIEAIQSVQVLTNPYASEYGEFTGAVTSIETKSGTDKFDTEFQNFFPRIRRRGGHFVGIEGFTPRLALSGPIKKDKLWFMQSFEYRFVRTPVESLPPLTRDTNLESFDSVTQLDYQAGDRDHVTTTFSLFPQKLTFVNLNTFNPQPVTPDFRQKGFFWAANERHVFSGKSFLESLFSIKRFDANVYPSSGPGVMNFAPNGNSGSFFNQQQRNTNRYELVENFSFTPGDFLGAHSMKVGGGFNFSDYDGSNTSTTARVVRADGTRSRQIDFLGSGAISTNKSQGLAYFQDKWDVNERLSIEYGLRYDRDTLANENNLAPRFAFSFLPIADGRTVIRGGIGLFYDQIDLNVASFEQLQRRVISFYSPNGLQLTGTPIVQSLVLQDGEFKVPRSVNFNLEFDREWFKNFIVRVGYEQRSGSREFVLEPSRSSFASATLLLSNSGLSRYRELHVTARYHASDGNELVASYVRSAATGDVNDFNSFFGNFENPFFRADQRARLNFDSPNRFILWGTFNVKWGVTVSPVFDVREGFPYSVIDQDRNFVGPRNSKRYPTFGALDLQVLKTFPLTHKLEKYRIRGGVKLFNITDHFNPRDVQNNIDSANFGTFYNGVGRMFAFKFSIEKK